MMMELSIDMSPLLVTSFAHRETMMTKKSCIALLLIVAFSENFFISGPCTKRAIVLTVKTEAADIMAGPKKMGLQSVNLASTASAMTTPHKTTTIRERV